MKTENYNEQQKLLSKEGKHIIAHFDEKTITVYQAFRKETAEFAAANQKFGGNFYSFTRMTWIKPNFMWMMYRSGWALKPGQERILAIKLKREGFDEIVNQAVHSSFQPDIYANRETWQEAVQNLEVRLQWDPDHDPAGEKLTRKAIQLGLRGEVLQKFNNDWIVEIEDITSFVAEQREFAKRDFEGLVVPVERVYPLLKN